MSQNYRESTRISVRRKGDSKVLSWNCIKFYTKNIFISNKAKNPILFRVPLRVFLRKPLVYRDRYALRD